MQVKWPRSMSPHKNHHNLIIDFGLGFKRNNTYLKHFCMWKKAYVKGYAKSILERNKKIMGMFLT